MMIDFDFIKRFQPKPKNKVGLDIGSHSIKILEVLPASDKPTLISFGSKKIQGLPRDAVSASIKSLAEELKISAKEFSISLSGPPLIARLISMPRMSSDELKSAVRFETEKLMPFDINECVLDFQVLAAQEKASNTDVLLAAVKRETVLQKMKLVQDAGFSVRVVDVDSFAVANAFIASFPALDQAKTFAVLNMGATMTNVSILRGSSLAVVRDITIGGNDFTAAISKKMGLSPQAAEELKVTFKDKAMDVTDCVRPVFTNLLDEIKLSFGYHENQSGRGIDEIYVSGGSADMAGLDDLFQDALGSKPRRWDPFQFLRAPDIDTTALGSLKNSFGVAIGLALR